MENTVANIQVDAVIPWVNGNDEKWQEKINKHLENKIDFNKKKESSRFNSIGEIDIAIKSIIKYAPFFKNIYLVTDNQRPDSFNKLKELGKSSGINLEIIDHKLIFEGFEEFLPCFNSRSIESVLFKIPKLSEHYVIFNDDTFIMRETKIEDFFVNGYPVIRGKWMHFYENQTFKNLILNFLNQLGFSKNKKRSGNKKVMQNSAQLVGCEKFIRRFHTPIPIRKSTQINFFNKNNILENNIKHKFRHETQFIISSLTEHLEFKQNTFLFKRKTKLTYFRSYKNHFIVKLKLFWFDINKNKTFITCQSLEQANTKSLNYILNWINKRIE